MLPTTPINIFVNALDWTAIPSSDTFTIGSEVAIGGVGIIGHGYLADVCVVDGPSGGSVSSPVPTAKVLQGGIVGTPYAETIAAQEGTAPYTFAVTTGTLPAGLALNGTTGVLSGTPTATGTSDFTIQATDANATTGSTDFEVAITASGGGEARLTNYCAIN